MKNTIFADYPDVVSVEDVQAMLRIGRNAAYGLLKSGAISTVRVGKKYIIPKTSIINFLSLNDGADSGIIKISNNAPVSLERSTQ